MKWANSIQRRFVAAYLFFALGSCILLGIIAFIAVEGIEVRLVDDRLASAASWASPRYAAGLSVEMPNGLNFYHGEAIPQPLRGLPPGVHDMELDGAGVHVLADSDATGNYVVIDHASDYDEIELVVYLMVAAGFMIFLALSLVLGIYVARRFVSPINKLASAVQDADSHESLPFLQDMDEMGTLARAFASRTEAMRQYLDRERFFTGDVSHELRTPLTIITGAAEILLSETAQHPAIHAHSDRILRAAREATECINILLLLARTPNMIDAAETPIAELVIREVERCRPLVSGKPVELRCCIESEFSVRARQELLAAAIGNLIRNACQYTDKGCVLVRVSRDTVAVEDTGPGMPEIIQERLMGRAPASMQAGSAGAGLGLSLVRRIAELLGISIEISAKSGAGTVISLQFANILTKT